MTRKAAHTFLLQFNTDRRLNPSEHEALRVAINELAQEIETGRWVPVKNGRGGHECNQCNDYAPSYQSGAEYLSKWCPNCGAKMKSEE